VAVDVEKIRARLDADRKRLLAELDELSAAGRPSEERREGSPFGKREEEATESLELERRLALERGMKEQLADIEKALDKIAKGKYGRCEICGRPIEQVRLEALPQARLCLSCIANQAKNARAR
jgi:RNA polymerase-binding transcription factor DksA